MSTEEIILWVASLLPGSANCQFAASFFKALQLTGTLEAWPPILWVVSLLPRSANCQFAASSFKVLRLAGILQAGLGARWFEDLPSLLLSFYPSLLLSLVNAGKTRPSLSNSRPPRSNSRPGPSTFRLFSSNSGPLMSISLPGSIFSLHVQSFHYPDIELHGSAPAFPRPILEFHGSARLSHLHGVQYLPDHNKA